MKKNYKKPIITSEALYEKSALLCSDYAYYAYYETGCSREYVGNGKESNGMCYENGIYS